MRRELKIWWNFTTLSSYLEKGMIPQGLRINKSTTFTQSKDFKDQWELILTECSLKLIKLIVQQEEKELEQVKMEIEELRENLLTSDKLDLLSELETKSENFLLPWKA